MTKSDKAGVGGARYVMRMFPKADLQDMVHGEQPETYKPVGPPEYTGSSRWSKNYSRVFEFDGKLYSTTYSVGATEYQDERPYEYEGAEVLCCEVRAEETTVTKYFPVPIEE